MVGGVGRVNARRDVRKATRSFVTGPRNGKSASRRSGNSSRNARGFTTAPERQCSPSASAFSSTPMFTSVCSLWARSEEHTSELQSRLHLVCRLLLEKKKKKIK